MGELSEEELWGELDDADGQRRGEILLELADRCYHRNEMAQFQALVEAAAEASESAGDDRLAAYARFNQGQGLMELERLSEAAAHFLQAAGFFQLIGEQADVALCNQRAGDAFGALGERSPALEHWRTALTLFAAEDDPLSEGRVHMAMGAFHMGGTVTNPDPGELAAAEEAAEECFHAARAAFRRARSAPHVAWADDAAAEALIRRGRVAEALPLLRACLDIARVATDDLGRGYGGLRLGLALRLHGDHIEALSHLRDARGAYADDENLMGMARCDLEAALCLRAVGELVEAEMLFGQARSIFDALGADEYLVLADRARAEMCLQTGRAAEAAGIARHSLALAQQTDQRALALDHAALLADALLELDEAGTALEVVHEHLIGIDTAEPLDAARHQRVVARALLAQGQAEEALAVVDAALAIPEVRNDPALHAELYELRWRGGDGGPGSDRDLAHAIALFLAADDPERATALSRHFLPAGVPSAVRATDLLPMQSLRPPLVDEPRSTGFDGQ